MAPCCQYFQILKKLSCQIEKMWKISLQDFRRIQILISQAYGRGI